MAHYAKLDINNIVVDVHAITNERENEEGIEGIETWLSEVFGNRWKKTSYNGNIRKNYAGIDFTFDSERDAFIPPQPFPSWVLDEDTCQWESPVPYPGDDDTLYEWNESTVSWDEVE
jgi:hypothetical protein